MCLFTSAFQTSPTASSSNFKVIFEKALKSYNKTTGQDRTANPLFNQIQSCNSPAAIRSILQDQVDLFIRSRSGDERLKNWLNPTLNVLYAFSVILGGGVGSVMSFHLSGISFLCGSNRFSLPPMRFLLAPVSSFRLLWTSKQARMSLLMSLNASKTSFEDLKFTPMSHQLRR
ncbi:hypothetical protein EI94DRAFT_653554 [Lactarius quietus]|nr:hypothetical protein EI94DRAFT_653554 [Lactarius quietus]